MYRMLLLLTALLLQACTPTKQPNPTDDSAYFPLETGRFLIYTVTEDRFSLTSPPSHQTYQIKERTGSAYTDASGTIAYRIFRYRRDNGQLPWQADSIWSARRTSTEAIRTENGQSFVRLVFPAADRQTWNGNNYNPLGEDLYELRNKQQAFSVLESKFNRTVTVIQQQDSTLVAQDKRLDVYAFDVGLIYRQKTQLQYCTSSPVCIGQAKIDYGIRQTYQILTYGKE